MSEAADVDVIILSWDRLEDTMAAITSALEQEGISRAVWVVDQGNYAFKVDPDTLTYEFYDGLDSAYTYSDMTGWGLANVANPEG